MTGENDMKSATGERDEGGLDRHDDRNVVVAVK